MQGVLATIHNGTTLAFAGDALQVDFINGPRNYSFNASSGEEFFADTFTINKIWIKFTADASYNGQSSFVADIGLRAFNKTNDTKKNVEEDDDDDKPFYPKEVIPISKMFTFNEKVIMNCFFWGILVMCAKKKWCNDNLCFCHPFFKKFCCPCCCERIKRKRDNVENEFVYKVKQKRLDFDVNMSHSDEDEEEPEFNEKEA